MTTLFAQAYAPYLALGIGEHGGRAAAAGCLDGFGEKLPWSACDTQAARLLATGLERKLRLDLPRAARPEFIGRSLDAQREQIRRLTHKKDLILLFGALDEAATAPLISALGERFRREKLQVCAVALEPLLAGTPASFEGIRNVDLHLHLSAASRAARLDAGVAAGQLFRLGEETLLHAVEALLAALAGCDTAPGFSFEELRAFLRGGPIPAVAASAHGRDALLASFESALAAARLEKTDGAALALATGREVSLTEVRTIRERLRATFGPDAPVLLGFGTEHTLADDARCLLMSRPSASRNVVSLMA